MPALATPTTSTSFPSPSTTEAPPATTTPPTTSPTTPGAPATDAAGVDSEGGTDASPVPGLDAAELRAALAAPLAATTRSGRPTLDQVVLADGTKVWRVRIPGGFAARSARVTVSVGDRRVGTGVVAGDLGSLTAVTTDGTGLVAGRAVSYQWDGGLSQPAGALEVVR